jgi:hypothetical protein
MSKSVLTRAKDAARKRIERFIATYPYVANEATIERVVDGDHVSLRYSFITPDPAKQADLARLFEKRDILPADVVVPDEVPVSHVHVPTVEETELETKVTAAIESLNAVVQLPKFRVGSKRQRIVAILTRDERIHEDDLKDITGWSNAVNNSEMHQIATLFKRKIKKSKCGFYAFVD